MRLHLKKSVKYRFYGNYVYLRNTASRKDYLFNDIVFDILEIIRNAPGCTEKQVLHTLAEMYDVEHVDTFERDITGFFEELLQEELLDVDVLPDKEKSADIVERIREQCCKEHRLYNVCFELTYRCNERCIHCYIDDQTFQKELTFEQYRIVIDELANMGCAYLLLTGGEPTLHPDFLKIAEYASQKGFLVDIYTNGYNVPENMLRRMIALMPNSISFSFYGSDAQSHDAITQIPGSFEKSLKTMMMCKCAGIDTYIKSVALKQNYDSLEKLYQMGKLLGISVVTARAITPSHSGEKMLSLYQLDRECQYIKLLDFEQRYQGREISAQQRKPGMTFCAAGETTLSVDPYGNVTPCNSLQIPLGNITSQSIQEIWNSSVNVIRQSFPTEYPKSECSACKYIRFCNVCLGTIYGADGKRMEGDQTCLIARAAYHTYERRNGSEKGVSGTED